MTDYATEEQRLDAKDLTWERECERRSILAYCWISEQTGYSLNLLEEALTHVNCAPWSFAESMQEWPSWYHSLDWMVFHFVLGLTPWRPVGRYDKLLEYQQ